MNEQQHFPIEIPGGRIYDSRDAEQVLGAMWAALGTAQLLTLLSRMFCERHRLFLMKADEAFFVDSRRAWERGAEELEKIELGLIKLAEEAVK